MRLSINATDDDDERLTVSLDELAALQCAQRLAAAKALTVAAFQICPPPQSEDLSARIVWRWRTLCSARFVRSCNRKPSGGGSHGGRRLTSDKLQSPRTVFTKCRHVSLSLGT